MKYYRATILRMKYEADSIKKVQGKPEEFLELEKDGYDLIMENGKELTYGRPMRVLVTLQAEINGKNVTNTFDFKQEISDYCNTRTFTEAMAKNYEIAVKIGSIAIELAEDGEYYKA